MSLNNDHKTVDTHASAKTRMHQNRDFIEWHQGIRHYGFWAVVIDHPQWLRCFDLAQSHMATYLLPGYQRQPHVTIACSGLMSSRHFTAADLKKQRETLEHNALPAFRLSLGQLGTFIDAPYLSINDNDKGLAIIKSRLTQAVPEDSPSNIYTPHMTLGFYHNTFHLLDIEQHINAFPQQSIDDLHVNRVQFCVYQTHNTQGTLSVIEEFELASM